MEAARAGDARLRDALAGRIGGNGPAPPEPASSPLHDALNAVAAAAHTATTGHDFGPMDLWPVLARYLRPVCAG